jgi:hypothetical protein
MFIGLEIKKFSYFLYYYGCTCVVYLTVLTHELISTSVFNVFVHFSLYSCEKLYLYSFFCATVPILCGRLYLYSLVYVTVLTRVRNCTCLVCATVPILARVRDCTYLMCASVPVSCARLYLHSFVCIIVLVWYM